MSKKPENPYAFPVEPGSSSLSSGMTLRDWFAGQVVSHIYPFSHTPEEMAATAYRIADALLSERRRD